MLLLETPELNWSTLIWKITVPETEHLSVCDFLQSRDKPLQIVIAVGINVYEWIESEAIKPPLVLYKWAAFISSVLHIYLFIIQYEVCE